MSYNVCRLRLMPVWLLVVCGLSTVAVAGGSHERTQVASNISIGPDEDVSEATCFGCSIRVRGHVSGDVTTFGGSIVVEEQGKIDGAATTFGGDVRLSKNATVQQDVTVFGGRIRRDPAATVKGDVTNMGAGSGWIVLIFAAPFVVLGLFVWLVVWFVRRLMSPSTPATA